MFDLAGITFIKVHGISSVYHMKHSYLKISPQKAGVQSPLTGSWVPGEEDDKETQETVRRMLGEIRGGGEEAARGYAETLDHYTGDILLSDHQIQELMDMVPDKVHTYHNPTIAYTPRPPQDKASIDFSVEQVVRFAAETRAKNQDWEVELGHGSTAGTK